MKKLAGLLAVVISCFALSGAFAAVKTVSSKKNSGAGGTTSGAGGFVPKKASAVAMKESEFSTSKLGASLLPNVVSLATSAVQIVKQQKELSAECEPTSREINFVNNMVKEWAYAGAANPLGDDPENDERNCSQKSNTSGYTYRNYIEDNYDSMESVADCFDVFDKSEADGAVWANFPKASVATYCPDGSCTKNSKKASNMWELFDLVEFTEDDYTVDEWKEATALMEKAKNCSAGVLAAKKKEALTGLVTGAISNVGQSSGTGDTSSIMEMVTGMAGQKGLGGLGGITSMAGQFLNR